VRDDRSKFDKESKAKTATKITEHLSNGVNIVDSIKDDKNGTLTLLTSEGVSVTLGVINDAEASEMAFILGFNESFVFDCVVNSDNNIYLTIPNNLNGVLFSEFQVLEANLFGIPLDI
jgi:hypothetical protein